MPITADDLLASPSPREAARAAQSPSPRRSTPEASTTVQPTSDGGVQAFSDAFAENFPKPVQGLVRGLTERTAEPAMRVAGVLPRGGVVQTAGDVMQVGAALHPATATLALGGAAVQGAAEMAGLSPNVSRVMGALSELGAGGFGLFRAGRKAAAEGEALTKAGAKLKEITPVKGVAQLTPTEKLGGSLKELAFNTLTSRKRTLSNGIDALDREIVKRVPGFQPGTPGYARLNDMLRTVEDRAITFSGDTNATLTRVSEAIGAGRPVSMADAMKLRKQLRQLTNFTTSPNPDLALGAKNAGAVRRELTDAIELGLPDELAGRYAEARMAYRTQYAEPWRNLKAVLNRDTTPQQAFAKVFNPDDMHTFRAMSEVVGNNPAVRGKLQMGFLESLADATNSFQDAEKALETFKNMRVSLASSGLFSREELAVLQLSLERRELPTMIEKLRTVLDEPLTLKKGGVGTAIGFFALHNPILAVSAMIGSGALPQLRRITVLPEGSIAGRKLAVIALNKAERMAQMLAKAESKEALDESGLDQEE